MRHEGTDLSQPGPRRLQYRREVPLDAAPPRARFLRFAAVVLVVAFVVGACAEDERREIRLTPTSTVETGIRVLTDNCPGPDRVSLLVRDDVLWSIERIPVADVSDETPTPTADSSIDGDPEPGLVEFLVGQTPDGWRAETILVEPVTPGIRYTIRTEPDGQSIDFSTPDLSPGLLWDGSGNAQFNPDLIRVECSEPADVEGFARNILVLAALWVTAAAAAMVALILLLFVITRRFSRIRSLQRRAERDAENPPTQQRRTSARS